MDSGTDVFEILHTTRSMRRLKPDPVPDELIVKILEAGLCAANGGNVQTWRFMVIKDHEIKQKIQRYYKQAFDETVGARYRGEPPAGVTRERYTRQGSAVEYLTDHFAEAPVWIVACLEEAPWASGVRASGANIYPAVQNMLLAIRALGLGSTLTTRHLLHEAETERILGLPPNVHSYAILPIGYPMGKFGPVSRRSMTDVVFGDRFGEPWSGLQS
jgi:nitroreductase